MARDPWKLDVFREAHILVLSLYRLTSTMPQEERYGLHAQLRRAAVSVPTNIAEGSARRSTRECARLLDVALGSAAEVRYLLRLTGDLGLLDGPALADCRKRSEHVVFALHKLQSVVETFSDRR